MHDAAIYILQQTMLNNSQVIDEWDASDAQKQKAKNKLWVLYGEIVINLDRTNVFGKFTRECSTTADKATVTTTSIYQFRAGLPDSRPRVGERVRTACAID